MAPEPDTKTDVASNSESTAVDIWDRTETRSLLNQVPVSIQAALLEASKRHPEWFCLDERTLWKRLNAAECRPTQSDNVLRAKFWFEYDSSCNEHRKFEISAVYAGVCSKQFFHAHYLKSPSKMAWIATPPLDYQTKLEEAVSFGAERMRDILDIDPETWSPKKADQAKLMELQAKVYAMLDARKNGAFTQKVEQKNMNLNVSTTDKQVASHLVGSTMEQLERKLKELERRERTALNLPESHEHAQIEVLPKEEDG